MHTRADKQFVYNGAGNDFVKEYVAALKQQEIRLGVIANHNKFNKDEFKALRKNARAEEIFLLPGVELSVGDGSGGIHLLIVFSEQWLEAEKDYINSFLAAAFHGKTPAEYENADGRSQLNILAVLKKLEEYGRDFFVVFAHVEKNNGLWKGLGGGRLQEISRESHFRKWTLGFQQVTDPASRDRVKGWLGDWYPAEVEGSDCKSISEIGRGRKCYLKIGASNFDAVKYALRDFESRVATTPQEYRHSHIKAVRFTGGTLDGTELAFSPELNTFIGIRGSGKSSVLEVLRYALGIPFGEKAGDRQYKTDLTGYVLGSGGKVEVDAVSRFGRCYTVRRIWKEAAADVLVDGQIQPGVSIQETVLHKPVYFGQKDLSGAGEGFEKDLVYKIIGAKLDEPRRKIAEQKIRVVTAAEKLQQGANVHDRLDEQKKAAQDISHRLAIYAAHGVEEKLRKQVSFDSDFRNMNKGIELAGEFAGALENVLANYEDDLRNAGSNKSEYNSELQEMFCKHYAAYISIVDCIKNWLEEEKAVRNNLSVCRNELANVRQGMVEEFAGIERKLAADLKNSGSQNISSGEFLRLRKQSAVIEQEINVLEKQSGQKEYYEDNLLAEIGELNDLWQEEFSIIKSGLDEIGQDGAAISIISEYKEDKAAFLSFMKETFKGSGIRENTCKAIADKYTDFTDIYRNFPEARKLFGSNPQILSDLFMKNLKSLLTYQTPNKFTIMYRGKELRQHSLGQRASALMLFILGQKDNDVIIIDQPEDDLDNQTLYEDVIKLIRKLKCSTQFVFATHNPNIPVLGDAELVQACSFAEDKETVSSGSIDCPEAQKEIITIMEGGQEAFDRRKGIYEIWKPWK